MSEKAYGVVTPSELLAQNGIDFLHGIISGRHPHPPICEVLNFHLAEADQGRAVFKGTPERRFYNPIGSVHGGWISTLLDSALG